MHRTPRPRFWPLLPPLSRSPAYWHPTFSLASVGRGAFRTCTRHVWPPLVCSTPTSTVSMSSLYRLKSVPKANVIPFYGYTDRLLKDGLNMEKQRSQSLVRVA